MSVEDLEAFYDVLSTDNIDSPSQKVPRCIFYGYLQNTLDTSAAGKAALHPPLFPARKKTEYSHSTAMLDKVWMLLAYKFPRKL